jgi:1-pyrroline-5-carboxylate dehydrogenase
MTNAIFNIPVPDNESVLSYGPGTPEREYLKNSIDDLKSKIIDIPLIINNKEIKTGRTAECRCPHDHSKVLAVYHMAGPDEIDLAVKACAQARKKWAAMPFHSRAAVFLKAAQLLADKWRYTINAATMLCQSKNPFQAEIDSACELIDFWRFNCAYAQEIYSAQPPISPRGVWNRLEYRPLEGFVFSITPFNFTSIAGNLPTAPAIMGNVSIWKPASAAVYSGYFLMKLLQEAGLPAGVVNFIPGSGAVVGPQVLKSPDLSGIHFTGSTAVFQGIWKSIGENIHNYKNYPRIVGETGGKDFIFAHSSADVPALGTALLRGAFEYQGQKCSAASRAYIPENIWPEIRRYLVSETAKIKTGPVEDFSNFMNAVIDKPSFDKIASYIEDAKKSSDAQIIAGGNYDASKGYFIEPTVIEALKPDYITMKEEIFGPVLTIYVYKADEYEKTLELCDKTAEYALTGAVFAQDREAIDTASAILENTAGNFYINDKPTGAVVGQQPFGGARASGTNDKAGSSLNLLRWVSARTTKETFVPPVSWEYPFMKE